MAGWLTFEQMRKGVDNLTEGSLYKPIEELAKGRGFMVRHEFPVPKLKRGPGANKEVDFLLINRKLKSILALEVKYKKQDRVMAGSITDDAIKLRDLTIAQIDRQILTGSTYPIKKTVKGYSLTKAVIIVWRSSDLIGHIVNKENVVILRQFRTLAKSMLPQGTLVTAANLAGCFKSGTANRPVGNCSGSLRSGSTITAQRFWVAGFLEIAAWSQL